MKDIVSWGNEYLHLYLSYVQRFSSCSNYYLTFLPSTQCVIILPSYCTKYFILNMMRLSCSLFGTQNYVFFLAIVEIIIVRVQSHIFNRMPSDDVNIIKINIFLQMVDNHKAFGIYKNIIIFLLHIKVFYSSHTSLNYQA